MMDTIGFLGCGNMGGAIARAVCKAVDPKKVFLANRTAAKAQALAKELGCKTATNAEVAGDCNLIFLAVKPQMMEALLQPLKFTFDERPSRFVLCSMAAGLSIARIQEMAGEDFPVIRIMPNTPASVGEGMIQYCSSNVTAEEEEAFLRIMAPAGRLDAVPESLIDAASCVSGCGPAWVYQFIEALADGGVACGLPRNLGPYEGEDLVIGIGKFGPYVRHGKSFASLARTDDPYTIGYDRAAELVREQQARAAAANTPLKTFAEEPELLIKNGRYGPYIAYKGKNYRIPKGTKPEEITLEACMKIIQTSKK